MNKQDLVQAVAQAANVNKLAASRMIDAFGAAVGTSLARGEKVTLTGFGTFSVAERGARTGRNPRTGKAIKIAASKAPKFKPGKALRDAVK